MGLINIRNTVQAHLFRERLEVFMAVVCPLLFMAESAYACGWIFSGGHLGFDVASAFAVARGGALEAFIYVCWRLIRTFVQKHLWVPCAVLVPVGLVAMIVSAGMNLGWMAQSPDMRLVVTAVAAYLPDWMVSIFRLGLGLLFPIGVAVFALFDISHLVEELIESSHLDNRAMIVQRAELHRSNLMKSIKQAARKTRGQFAAIADTDAQNIVESVKRGDFSFGAGDVKRLSGPAGVTKVSPAAAPGSLPPALAGLPSPAQPRGLPPGPTIPPRQGSNRPTLPPMPPTSSGI